MAYTLTGRKCGSVRFTETSGNITNEAVSMVNKVTSAALEDGSIVSEHVNRDPRILTLSGVLIGGVHEENTLERMRDTCDILDYAGRTRRANLLITQLSFDYNSKNAKGCAFKATLQQIQIQSAQYIEVGEVIMMSQQDAGKPASIPASQTSKDGLKTTVSQTISSSAYADYVNSYNNKPAPSTGPANRQTVSFSGVG